MIATILKRFSTHPSMQDMHASLARTKHADVHGLGGASAAFLTSSLFGNHSAGDSGGIVLAVLPDEEDAEAFRGDVEDIVGSDHLLLFPERDTSLYEHADSHFEVRSQRVETLDKLEHGWQGIIVASIGALHDPATPPGLISMVSLELQSGQSMSFQKLILSLVEKGFRRRQVVTAAGEIAVRGGIVDIFPFGAEQPYRVEFWGDEIESIRTFSTRSQRSIAQIPGFRIIPPDEFVTEAGIDPADERRITDVEELYSINLTTLRESIKGGDRPEGIEQYLHLVFGARASICSYLSADDMVVVFDPGQCRGSIEKRFEHAGTIWSRQRHDDPDLPPPEAMYPPADETMEGLSRFLRVDNHTLRPPGKKVVEFSVSPARQYQADLAQVKSDIRKSHSEGMLCHIACDNSGQAERLKELLDEVEGEYTIDIFRISGGFTDHAAGITLLTDHEIFGRHQRRVRYRRFKEGVPIPDYRSLSLGDFVVHVDYGIGKYMGLKRISAGGVEKDCLLIRYRGDDKVFLPVEQLKRLKKFTAEEGVTPVVNKLGGTAWEKLKTRTKQSIERMAKDLLRLYAERKLVTGHAFAPDEQMLRALEESFEFEETRDQTRAWADVREDMENPAPMERLICGDVGFGKTEIAIRAAFLAALDGKKVAVLVPTTILAEQHGETFGERLADFPVKVQSISRFKSRKEQKQILDSLAAGDIDIIIGTHRLLSKDVHVKDLGLLVIDEEQQFGVRHKELLKKLKKNTDVLAMSATPIPRTLNMSLLGARDLSFINTPPVDRYSVHTEVVPFEEKYVIEAIMREIDRDGQVFFVHNRVRSIEGMAAYLRRLLPNVSFGVAHGQMTEKKLEKVMQDFYHHKFQVLVSTMIIENGLDIPSVNTIVINRADTFGLSQLYQLRGRVGRSSVRAFAYLLIPPKTAISKIAQKRLRTIEELVELGSGFNIAMRDLELRGAGNILGTQQSGFIAAVGFDLYSELLQETIAELRGETVPRPPDVEIHSKCDMFLSDSYIDDPNERVQFYRRLSEAVAVDEVSRIEEELADRYGRFPEPVDNLLASFYIRHYAALLDASNVTFSDNQATIFIPEGIEVTRKMVEGMVKKSSVKLQFSFERGMMIAFPINSAGKPMHEAKKVLQALTM